MGNTTSSESPKSKSYKLTKPRLGGRRDSRLSLAAASKPDKKADDAIKQERRKSFFRSFLRTPSTGAEDAGEQMTEAQEQELLDVLTQLSPTRSMPNLREGFVVDTEEHPVPSLPANIEQLRNGAQASSMSVGEVDTTNDHSIPVRRRSLLFAPRAGVATRKSTLKLKEDSALSKLAALDLAEHPRTPTPTAYSVIGAYKRGSLVITNGAVSPTPSSIDDNPYIRSVSSFRGSIELSPSKLKRDSVEVNGYRGSIELNGPRPRAVSRISVRDVPSPLHHIMTNDDATNLSTQQSAHKLPASPNFSFIDSPILKSAQEIPPGNVDVAEMSLTPTCLSRATTPAIRNCTDLFQYDQATSHINSLSCTIEPPVAVENPRMWINSTPTPLPKSETQPDDVNFLQASPIAPKAKSMRTSSQRPADDEVVTSVSQELLASYLDNGTQCASHDGGVQPSPLPIPESASPAASLRNGTVTRTVQVPSRGDSLLGSSSNSSSRPSLSDSGYSSYSSMADFGHANWKFVGNRDQDDGDATGGIVMKDHRRSWVNSLRDETITSKRDSGMEISDEPPFIADEFDEDEEKRFSQSSMLAPLPVFGQGTSPSGYASQRPRSMVINRPQPGDTLGSRNRNRHANAPGGSYPPPRPPPNRQYHRYNTAPVPRRIERQTPAFKEQDFNPLFHDDNPGASPYDRAALALSSMSAHRPGLSRARTTLVRPKSMIYTPSGINLLSRSPSTSSMLAPPRTAGSSSGKSESALSDKRKKRRSFIFGGHKDEFVIEDLDEWRKERDRWGMDTAPPVTH